MGGFSGHPLQQCRLTLPQQTLLVPVLPTSPWHSSSGLQEPSFYKHLSLAPVACSGCHTERPELAAQKQCQPMTDSGWWANTPAFWPLGGKIGGLLYTSSQRFPAGYGPSVIPSNNVLLTHTLCSWLLFLVSFPLPGITFQISYLPLTLAFKESVSRSPN